MVNPLVVKRKLKKMAEYLDELESAGNISLDEYLRDFRLRRAVERLIQLIVDVAIDVNTHVVVDAGRPAPEDAYGSFIEAASLGLIPDSLAREIAPSTGERNIIVHEYEDLDDTIVYESIADTLRLYRDYIRAVVGYLDRADSQSTMH